MFPAGVAGVALFCIRIAASAMLLIVVEASGMSRLDWVTAVCMILAFCLCLGALTPFVCAASCAVELNCFSGLSGIEVADQSFLILVTASLVVLGPGAYSLDARLFGRRVIKR
jgi:hypothetical protein